MTQLMMKLLKIKEEKRTSLCIAADRMSIERTVRLIERVGPHICMLKIHSRHFGADRPHKEYMEILYQAKKKYNFLLFEDAKFFDGAETVRSDYEAHFAKYVDIVTVVPLGDDILRAIARGAENANLPEDEPRGSLGVCELSFKGIVPLPIEHFVEVVERNRDVCIGFIGQRIQKRRDLIKAVPGVNIDSVNDGYDQQWRNPDEIKKDGADIFIVGRGITSKPEDQWESLAIRYKEACWG